MPDPPAPPASGETADSPELAALKRQNALLQERVSQFEQTKKLVDALTPTLPEGAKGTLTLAGEPLESRLLAYRQVDRAGEGISDRVRSRVGKAAVIVHDAAAVGSLVRYRAFVSQLDQDIVSIRRELELAREAVFPPAPAQAGLESIGVAAQALPLVASAALKSITGLIALFRQDVSVTAAAITIADTTLVAAVCGHLAAEGIAVYHPSLVPPGDSSPSTLLRNLETLWNLRADAQALLNELTAAKQEKTEAEATLLSAAHVRVTSLASSVDELRAGLAKPDSVSGLTPLADLLRSEALAAVAANAHLMWVKVSGAGGSSEIRQPGAFHRAGKRRYSGGVLVEFLLFDAAGAIVEGGILPLYSGLVEIADGEHEIDLIDSNVT